MSCRMMLVTMLGMLLLAGCTSTALTLDFVALKPVNEIQLESGSSGESRVVDVRVFQLKDDAKFKAATVDAIWTNAEEVLGDSLVEVKLGESVFPEDPDGKAVGKQITLDPINTGTKFIGILALFSNSDEGERKVVVPLEQADDVLFELTGYHINIKNK
ncbi:MAG: type VI secretion system lipoprotein TssJ [Planctomycetota bacterium]|nr:type VI secretion system lipoprotein TssJ [Planctomycetota bacterium]